MDRSLVLSISHYQGGKDYKLTSRYLHTGKFVERLFPSVIVQISGIDVLPDEFSAKNPVSALSVRSHMPGSLLSFATPWQWIYFLKLDTHTCTSATVL